MVGRLTFDGNYCDIAMCQENPCPYNGSCTQREVWEKLKAYEDAAEQGRLKMVPCKVGDMMWGIRKYGGKYVKTHAGVARAKVTEMYFSDGMRLCIAMKGLCRGEYGKTVFGSRKEAEAALAKEV